MSGLRMSGPLAGATALTACAAEGDAGLGAFERTLAGHDSATAGLAQWCATHGIADPAALRALPVPGPAMPPPPDFLRLLAPGPGERLAYRHVRLVCGDKVLSDAHNWYVPARLPHAMNQVLETSDVPFGRVVAPLNFTRKSLGSQRGEAGGCPAGTVLANRAALYLPGDQPISAVIECYTAANLALAE